MKRMLKIFTWVVVAGAVIAALVFGYGYIQGRSGEPAAREDQAGPLTVTVTTVQTGDIVQSVWVTGEVEALHTVDLTPEVHGRLERLRLPDGTFIEEGVEVEKGQVVAVIERDQYEAAVSTAEATVAVAEAALERAKVTLADARREKDRWTKLVEQGAGTQQKLDQVITAFQRAQADLGHARAQVRQAEANLAQAQLNLDKATIKASFDGVVSRKFVDEGAFVTSNAPLLRLVDIHAVEISGGVADRHYPLLAVGKTRAEVEVDAYPEKLFSGRVSRLRPELNQATRTVVVTIRVPNPDGRLKPGMFARLRLVLQERKGVPVVVDQALVTNEGKTRVYVVNDSVVHVREVRIGLEEGTENEVLEGLRPGDRVVVRGQRLLSDGMVVEAVERGDSQ